MKENAYYLLPYKGIGGVEMAAESLSHGSSFDINYIYPDADILTSGRAITYYPRYIFSEIFRLINIRPSILIVSLWRSCFVGLIFKVFFRKNKLVVFLHATKDSHFLDWLFTRLAILVATEVWSDSEATLLERSRLLKKTKNRVISFLIDRLEYKEKAIGSNFIFWGRLAPQKNLIRTINIFKKIMDKIPDSTLKIIGPDCGELDNISRLLTKLDMVDSVSILGELNINEIVQHAEECHFYLQTSLYEGMAVSVIEAMQIGLIPVVTPVGEIRNYTSDGVNAIWIDDDRTTIASIIELSRNPAKYKNLSVNAAQRWKNETLYRDSMEGALIELIES